MTDLPTESPITKEMIEAELVGIIAPWAWSRWWNLPIPKLHNATPQQCWDAGDRQQVLDQAKSYSEVAFT